jgi:small subunit ribosomal protein S15|tara:strand:+ start:79 stop:351 length:273 start_codon:yes stop_codon:yes gene_type:complete
MLTAKQKGNIIKKFQTHDKDTGSSEVQIAMLTKKINELAKHLKTHMKDNHSRRGLLQMVASRRSHLKYLEKINKRRFNALAKSLSLKSKS